MSNLKQFISNLFKSKPKLTNEEPGELYQAWTAYEKANELFDSKLPEEALQYYDMAIHPLLKEAYCHRAFCLQALNYHYDAIEDFNKAIIAFESDANLYYGRACSYMALDEYEIAEPDLKMAIRLSQQDTELNRHRNKLAKSMNWSSAVSIYIAGLKDCLQMISLFSDNPEVKEKMKEKLEVKRR